MPRKNAFNHPVSDEQRARELDDFARESYRKADLIIAPAYLIGTIFLLFLMGSCGFMGG